ncbi:hypothetical protein CI102_5513 [Trichoderma harzianum]|nr:hypothetical protein CI102_5513 [Trichoderma harzianum]
MDKAATASHALAQESDANIDPQIKDRDRHIEHNTLQSATSGWHSETTTAVQSYASIRNGDLWTLIRRFNKQIFHVKRIYKPPLSNLDMNIAAGEDITGEKVLVALYKHIVLLRSWRDKRTLYFCTTYSIAWLVDLLAPTFILFLIVLIICPPVRDICFPPAPASLISSRTGAVKKPMAGVLASESVTGAPEENSGEAIEQEAHSFIYSISTLLMNISSGEFSQEEQDSVGPEHMVQDVSDVLNETGDQSKNKKNHDRTKEPVARAVQSFHTRSALHTFPELIDTCERLGNALSPTSPFPTHRPRLIMATCLLPLLMTSFFGSCYGVMKVLGLFTGAIFFGKPIIERGVSIIDYRYPDWRQHIEMRNSILKGVPTNVQIAITLLRTGETLNMPQPPPPSSHGPPNVQLNADDYDLAHLGASKEDTMIAIDPVSDKEYSKQTYARQEKGEPSTTRRIANCIKRTTKDGIQAMNKIAKAAEPSNSEHLPGEQSALKSSETHAGPTRFSACHKGKKGYVYITTTATTPAISWISENEDLDTTWTIAIADVREVRKVSDVGSLGGKKRALTDWALERETTGGLVLKTEPDGEFCLTSVTLRDAVFNRIISVGSQMWEIW